MHPRHGPGSVQVTGGSSTPTLSVAPLSTSTLSVCCAVTHEYVSPTIARQLPHWNTSAGGEPAGGDAAGRCASGGCAAAGVAAGGDRVGGRVAAASTGCGHAVRSDGDANVDGVDSLHGSTSAPRGGVDMRGGATRTFALERGGRPRFRGGPDGRGSSASGLPAAARDAPRVLDDGYAESGGRPRRPRTRIAPVGVPSFIGHTGRKSRDRWSRGGAAWHVTCAPRVEGQCAPRGANGACADGGRGSMGRHMQPNGGDHPAGGGASSVHVEALASAQAQSGGHLQRAGEIAHLRQTLGHGENTQGTR